MYTAPLPFDGLGFADLPAEDTEERELTDDEVLAARLEHPGDFGLCHGCAREGLEEPAQPGHTLCEECEFGAPCVACRGLGTANGKPMPTSTYASLVAAESALCLRCGGTGCESDALPAEQAAK
jgi:hypothetical protein